MVQASYLRYGLMPGFVIFCTVLLTATEVLAQITPAPASNEISTSGSPDTMKSSITPSPNPSTNSSEQDTTSSEEQVDGGTTTLDNTQPDPTESLVEAITNQVNDVLSAAGIGLGS
jgi:hypothetical protein